MYSHTRPHNPINQSIDSISSADRLGKYDLLRRVLRIPSSFSPQVSRSSPRCIPPHLSVIEPKSANVSPPELCRLTQFPSAGPPSGSEFLSLPGETGGRRESSQLQRRDCSLPRSQHSPGTPGKVNSGGPSGKPRGSSLAPHTTLSVVRASAGGGKNWAMLRKSERTHAEALRLNGRGKSVFKLASEAESFDPRSSLKTPSLMGSLLLSRAPPPPPPLPPLIRNSTSAKSLQLFSL